MTSRTHVACMLFVALLLISGCTILPTTESTLAPSEPILTPSLMPSQEATAVPTQQSQSIPTSVPNTGIPTPMPMATPVVGVVAIVNGQPIPLLEYETQAGVAESYYSQQPDVDPQSDAGKAELAQLRRQVLDWMIDQVLIEQAAVREGIVIPDVQIDAEVEKMLAEGETQFNEWLQANGLTLDGLRERLRVEMMGAALAERVTETIPSRVEQVRVRHILLSTDQEANEVLAQLESGIDFAAVARAFSLDGSTAEQGGDLGFFPRGLMAPEFEEVAFSLNPGEVSGVIRTQFGYHIIEVLEKDPDREVPEEILPTLRQQAFQRWLESERADATIELFVE